MGEEAGARMWLLFIELLSRLHLFRSSLASWVISQWFNSGMYLYVTLLFCLSSSSSPPQWYSVARWGYSLIYIIYNIEGFEVVPPHILWNI